MNRLVFLFVSLFSFQAFGIDEYILPDAKNYVDVRHLRRATCSVFYYTATPPMQPQGLGQGQIVPKEAKFEEPASFPIGLAIQGGTIALKIVQRMADRGVGYGSPYGGGGGGYTIAPPEMRPLGTGVVYAESDTAYYIFTAGHVVGQIPQAYIQFSYAGERSQYIKAKIVQQVYKKGTAEDLATLKIEKSDLRNYPVPTILSLPSDNFLLTGQKVNTIRFGSVTPCTITQDAGHYFKLTAQIHQGNSGSGVFDEKAKHLIGIVLTVGGECISYRGIKLIIDTHNRKVKADQALAQSLIDSEIKAKAAEAKLKAKQQAEKEAKAKSDAEKEAKEIEARKSTEIEIEATSLPEVQ
jgi:hypothetical protein